jgi:hypothetical protein
MTLKQYTQTYKKKCKGEAVPLNAKGTAIASNTSHFSTTEKAVDIH